MTTTLTLWRIRSAKLAWLSSMLMLLLNRTPALRTLVSMEFSLGPRLGEMLRALVPLALAAGAVDTLTGATQFTSNPKSPASASVDQSFDMVFAVTGAPSTTKCYSIDGTLPAGLTVPNATVSGTNRTLNASNGSITGTPTESGSFTIQIKAWEKASRGGKSTNAYNVTINVSGPASTAPAFTTQPTSQTITAGGSVSFTIAVSGSPAPTLQWRKGGANLAGKTTATLTLSGATTGDAGTYDCVATNTAGSATSTSATLTVNAATSAPAFTTQPASQTATAGGSATFSVAVSGNPAPTLQWRFGGVNLQGQTGTSLALANVQAGSAGTYDCVATNTAGSATSASATLTVSAAAAPTIVSQPAPITSKIGSGAFFSIVAEGTGLTYQWKKNNVAIPGATKSTFAIASVLAGDAGNYSVTVSSSSGGAVTSSAAVLSVSATGSARLVNMSTRAGVGSLTGALIPGIVVEGDVSLTVLIRGVGPQLGGFGVAGFLADPVITVFKGSQQIATNDDWEQAPDLAALTAATSTTGAFPLSSGSKDAAMLISLPPGAYTVQVSGKNGGAGESLAEVYIVGPN